ncbi:aminoglycoside phosphotransferase family protein [Paramicrobacterium agarici]|uniref:aminoglycoside phosphotransferase family protein n=1 Tax=Paramicrobacterium agarici TaxID=630514 RepID=UPI001154BACE|nr:aminoglycoside phosphotransferase family protein [Microbacterium agarici]TQO22321.1 phosphotransferase family enzyme [Microbacterium agarici]
MQTATHELTIGETTVRKRFVTWNDGEDSREWAMLSLLAEHAPGIAPTPLRRERDGDAPVIIMSRLAGDPLTLQDTSVSIVAALGRTLQRVYRVPLTAAHSIDLRERRCGPTEIIDILRHGLSQVHSLDVCENPALLTEALESACAYIERDDARIKPRLTSIGIADLNSANVLWDGRVCRLVDFEDGGLTEPAFEIADHVEHLANRRDGNWSAELLSSAAGLSRDDVARMNKYRVHWAIFWLLMLLPGNGAFSRNPRGTTEGQARHFLRLLHAD